MAAYEPSPRAGGRKPGTKNKFSSATISRDIKEMHLVALGLVGGAKYLAKIAQQDPELFLSSLGRCILTKDDGGSGPGLTLQVVQLVGNGAPTPGVLSSPIAADMAPQRPLRLIETSEQP